MAGTRAIAAASLALLTADSRQRKVAVEITTSGGTLRYCSGSEPVTISGNVYSLRAIPVPDVAAQEPGRSRITLMVDDADHTLAVESATNRLSGRAALVTILNRAADNTWTAVYSGTWTIDEIDGDGQRCRLALVGSSGLKQRPILMEGSRECPYRQFKGTLCGYVGAVTECDRSLDACTAMGNQARFGGDSYALEPNASIEFESISVSFGAAQAAGGDSPPDSPQDPGAQHPNWRPGARWMADFVLPVADTPVTTTGNAGGSSAAS